MFKRLSTIEGVVEFFLSPVHNLEIFKLLYHINMAKLHMTLY